jgi:outer membrane receptor for ferrienterochelin and colicin
MLTKKTILLSLVTIPLLLCAENVTLDTININGQESNTTQYVTDGVAYVPFQKEGYMKSAPMQTQITGRQALEIAGTNGDPVKALKSIAGVVSTNNDDGSEIYIHGSKPRETRFSINHLPIGYLFHLGGLHSVIAPEMVEQIDAYLGGFDVTYGAMGAVVDISPKYPTGENKGRLHIGMYDADFAYDMSLGENTNLFISARRSYVDLIADKIIDELDTDSDDERKKTTFTLFPQFNDAQLILSHTVGNNVFSLEMLTAHDKLKINDTFNIEKDPLAVGKINADYQSNTMGARWIYAGDGTTSNTLLYRLYRKNKSEFFDADFFVDTSAEEYGLYHETVWELDKHTVTVGTEIKQINAPTKVHVTTPSTTDFSDVVTEQDVIDVDKTFKAKRYTVFAQDIWDITPHDHLRYGLRAWKTDFQAFGSGVDPRLAYVHNFSNDLTMGAAVGLYSQLPSTLMTIEGFGNPKIDTEELSEHYTLSIQKTFEDKSSLVVEPYFKKFKNLAIMDDLTSYEAVGEGEAYGVDITYKKKIANFDIMAAYTYVKASRQLNTNTNKQYRFEGDIPHTLQLSTNYHFANNWRFSAYAKYSSGEPYTPVVGTEGYTYNGKEYRKPVYGKPYSSRLDANYDLDLQIGKTYKYSAGSSLEYSLELMNVNALFRKNTEGIKYNDKYEEDGSYEQMGFLPSLHVNYRF